MTRNQITKESLIHSAATEDMDGAKWKRRLEQWMNLPVPRPYIQTYETDFGTIVLPSETDPPKSDWVNLSGYVSRIHKK